MADGKNMIEIRGLNKYFGDLHVLKDIDLTVKAGEKLVIIGPSGSGKSTLIRCVNFLEEPTTGTVTIDGTQVTKKNHLEMARKYSSMVFQQFNLYPNMTVLGNLTLSNSAWPSPAPSAPSSPSFCSTSPRAPSTPRWCRKCSTSWSSSRRRTSP